MINFYLFLSFLSDYYFLILNRILQIYESFYNLRLSFGNNIYRCCDEPLPSCICKLYSETMGYQECIPCEYWLDCSCYDGTCIICTTHLLKPRTLCSNCLYKALFS